MKIENNSRVYFSAKPNPSQMRIYTKSINEGLRILDKQVDVIIHNSSAPAIKEENTGIGSLFSRTTMKKLIPFLKEHGITGIQQEPTGLRKKGDFSPYAPEADSKNIFMIPLEKLAGREYHHILSKETFNKIVSSVKDYEQVDYPKVQKMYEEALREAFANFKKNKDMYEDFKKNFDTKDLEPSAVFRVLSKNDNENWWMRWPAGDRALYSPKSKHMQEVSKNRIEQLKKENKDEFEFYYFQQMILDKETKLSNELSQKTGVKLVGDSPVAQPTVTEWRYQDLFLKDKAIGCPPDFFSKNGQAWGFKYFNPDKIFNKDGSLGPAGEVLKKKYEDYFASCPGGVRIDHVLGLVDPFIYTVGKKMTPETSGRIYSQEGSEWQKHSVEEYANFFTKIIIPAAEKYGLKKEALICEDLGEENINLKNVMNFLKLKGLNVTQFDHRGKEAREDSLIMLGSHDNSSFLEFVENLFKNVKDGRFLKKTQLLAEDTIHQYATPQERHSYLEEIRTNKKQFIASSFAELFTSPAKRVQIFFTDFWGIPKTYNKPGTSKGNWSLRIAPDFEDNYYQAVKEGKAPNLAQVIAMALRQRGLDKGNEELMKNLNDSAEILSK